MQKRRGIKFSFSFLFLTVILFSFSNIYSQSTVISDDLQGKSSAGTKVGGSFTSEGYAPGRGTNHILYDVPKQIANGYIEFQMKGFNPSSVPTDEDNGFLAIYDGRGISEPIGYVNDFKQNYFRWNIHWRQNRNAFKAVLACAAPVSSRINSSKAVFQDKNGDGLDSHDRDWYSEPTGSGQSWNTSSWYTIKVQWNNKKFEVFVNGVRKWSTSGPYDYNPVDLKIWLGSAPGKYDADVNVTYRNFKLVDLGGSSTPTNSLAVSPSNRSVGSSSGSTTFAVTSNVSWTVSDNATWVTVSPTSGSNGSTLTASYSANTSSNSRTATITTSGGGLSKTVTLTQSGFASSGGSFSVSPASKEIGNSAGSFTINITTNGSWRVRDNTDWMNKTPKTGNGNGTSIIGFKANTTGKTRTGILSVTVGNEVKEIVVTQGTSSSGSGGSISVSPSIVSFGGAAGSFQLNIATNGNWRVRDNTDWLSKKPKTGTGNGNSLIVYKANTSGVERKGIISVTVGNEVQEIPVTQSALGQVSVASSTSEKENVLMKSNQEDVKVEIPKSYALNQNYPNPFNPSTVITFSLPKSDNVKLQVFNLLGEKIVTLVNKNLSAGYYNIDFDASKFAAGTYIYSIKTSDFVESKKMILLK